MMGMGEVLGGASQSTDRRYASLRCSIRVVTEEPELKPVLELFAKSTPSHEYARTKYFF